MMMPESPGGKAEAALAALTDAIGRYPPEAHAPGVPEALRDGLAGSELSRLLLTAELGGLGLTPAEAFDLIERVARVSGAVGLQLAWLNLSFLLAWLAPEARDRLMPQGDPPVVAGSVLAGGCREVTKDGDGWFLAGSWPSWTDPDRANLLIAGFWAATAAGASEPGVAFLPAPQAVPGFRVDRCRSLDGEFQVSIPRVRVPVNDTIRLEATARPGPCPEALILVLLAAVATGVAGSAMESFIRLAAKKWRPALRCPLLEDPVVAGRLRTASTRVAAARELTLRELHRDQGQASDLAGAALNAVAAAGSAIGSMFEMAGARAVFRTDPLQGCLANLQVIRRHALLGGRVRGRRPGVA